MSLFKLGNAHLSSKYSALCFSSSVFFCLVLSIFLSLSLLLCLFLCMFPCLCMSLFLPLFLCASLLFFCFASDVGWEVFIGEICWCEERFLSPLLWLAPHWPFLFCLFFCINLCSTLSVCPSHLLPVSVYLRLSPSGYVGLCHSRCDSNRPIPFNLLSIAIERAICLSISHSTYLSVCLSAYLSVSLYAYISICLPFICLFLCFCHSVFLCLSLEIFCALSVSMNPFFPPLSRAGRSLYLCLSVCLSVSLLLSLCFCLSFPLSSLIIYDTCSNQRHNFLLWKIYFQSTNYGIKVFLCVVIKASLR